MADLQFLTDAIVATYVKRHGELGGGKARHFLYRAARATQRDDVRTLFVTRALPYTENQMHVFRDYYENYDAFIAKIGETLSRDRALKINDQKKFEQWQQNLPICAYHRVMWELYYRRAIGLNEPMQLPAHRVTAVPQLILAAPNFVKYALVVATNSVMLSKHLGLFDCEAGYFELFRRCFVPPDAIADSVLFTNYIYGLTHVIIGASFFYQKRIDRAAYQWCLDIFDAYQNEIYDRLTLDINTEVALCYRIAGIQTNHYIERVKERLAHNFSSQEGYIVREESNSFEFAEHTNAIALLLFSDKVLQ